MSATVILGLIVPISDLILCLHWRIDSTWPINTPPCHFLPYSVAPLNNQPLCQTWSGCTLDMCSCGKSFFPICYVPARSTSPNLIFASNSSLLAVSFACCIFASYLSLLALFYACCVFASDSFSLAVFCARCILLCLLYLMHAVYLLVILRCSLYLFPAVSVPQMYLCR